MRAARLYELMLGAYERGLAGALEIALRIFGAPKRWKHATERAINRAKSRALQASLKSCGDGLSVQFPVTIHQPEEVRLGNRVSMAAYVHIWGGGGVTIGDRAMIGTHSSIASLTHDYSEEVMRDTIIRKPVVIEDDVWVGSNCVILAGVTIGKGAVVGAGSVVTEDVEANVIVAGVPARKLRIRR